MRTIVQISDIHFGKINAPSVDSLVSVFETIKPDLIIISGDLTQRARVKEFKSAQTLLFKLKEAKFLYLVIPGNHDIMPLYAPISRITDPYSRYKKYISDVIEPTYSDNEIAVASINTVRSSRIMGGALSAEQIARAEKWLSQFPRKIVKLVVTHHPLDLPIEKPRRKLAGEAERGVTELSKQNVDMYLSGHYHRSSVTRTEARYDIGGYAALAVQAGTLSKRQRGEAESFNVLRVNNPVAHVETYVWSRSKKCFEKRVETTYKRKREVWRIYN